MNIYVLTEYDAIDNASYVLGAFSSIEKINEAIKGKVYANGEFEDSPADSRMANYRNCWLQMTRVTLDAEEI